MTTCRVCLQLNLLCASIGAGAQLFTTTLCLLTMALLGVFAPSKRGSIVTACIVLYALCAGVGGFVSARLYRQLQGENWAWNIILATFMFPGPLLVVFSFLNTVAIANASTAALPFGTIVIVLALFVLVNLPLTVLGGVAGRNIASTFKAPCRTTKVRCCCCLCRCVCVATRLTQGWVCRCRARSQRCPSTAVAWHRSCSLASCRSQPSPSSCTTSSPAFGATKCTRCSASCSSPSSCAAS